MTNEEKQILLQDLCARLPYHLKGKSTDGKLYEATVIYDTGTILASEVDGVNTNICCGFKPYLRPMSSMTVVERKDLRRLTDAISIYNDGLEFESHDGYNDYIGYCFCSEIVDWLNAHHFDFRNLIERGLAIDCTNLNIY